MSAMVTGVAAVAHLPRTAVVASASVSRSPHVTPKAPTRRLAGARRLGGGGGRAALHCRAAGGEEDIEAIEKRVKGKRSKPKEGYFDSYPTKPANANYPPGPWESDPGTWDAKGAGEKVWLAWSGAPGFLWWMNKGSYWGAGGLAFGWVLFRLVGPALGLYQLN
eukprot:CAMPEP_0181361886 /NCGR_PEP_ID=MMETSP1106-20121128/7621_1 /TAXON_ID=81844 /ORGANISM="Mantoniella antarctica, Strain SL-175" /LENGTH=163 /DNA_ID=CAMNT_0023475621 /DNA_START=86 /DNA_END=577 /DNA_ORIENTATION=+